MRARFDPLAMSAHTLALGRRLTALLESVHALVGPFLPSPVVVAPTEDNSLLVGNTPLADLAVRAGLSGHKVLGLLGDAESCAADWHKLNHHLGHHPRLPNGTHVVLLLRAPPQSLLLGDPDFSCRPAHIAPGLMLHLGVSFAVLAERIALADKARRWSSRSLDTFTVEATGRPPLTVEAPGPRQALVADRFLHWTYIPAGTVRVVRDRGGSVVAHTKARR
jgi:hypothetical protein